MADLGGAGGGQESWFTLRVRVLLGLLACTFIGSVYLAYYVDRYTPQVIETSQPPSLAARRNPYLATFRVLKRLGLPVRHLHNLKRTRLPPADALFVITGDRSLLGGALQREVLDWAGGGGHLLVLPSINYDTDEGTWTLEDPILGAVGVELFDGNLKEALETGVENEIVRIFSIFKSAPKEPVSVLSLPGKGALKTGPLGGLTLGKVPVDGETLTTRWQVVSPAAAEQTDDEGKAEGHGSGADSAADIHILRLSYGKGTVTILADARFLTNDFVAGHDNALLLEELFAGAGLPTEQVQRVWWLTDLSAPSLGAILLEHGAWAVWGLVVLVALTVWRGAMGFGPRRPDPALSRRGLLEHIVASGRFHWRHGDAASLINATRQTLMSVAASRLAGFRRQTPPQQVKRLASLSGLSEEVVRQAIGTKSNNSSQDFTSLVQQLERIRASL